MPTFDFPPSFARAYGKLSPRHKERFREAIFTKFVPALKANQVPGGLRLKRYQAIPDAWELTWDRADGMRAVFKYGEEVVQGETHVVWIMVGDHTIL